MDDPVVKFLIGDAAVIGLVSFLLVMALRR